MSKVKKAKEEQGYQESPKFPTCNNCIHYKSDLVLNQYNYQQETNVRCGIGDFAIKKLSTCRQHLFHPEK